MTRKEFGRAVFKILAFNDIEVNEAKNDALYDLMKDDFGHDEFTEICAKIVKYETLYGRYPTPQTFYKYQISKKQIDDAILTERFSNFWVTVSSGLESRLSTLTDDDFTGIEHKTLIAFGGFRDLYFQVNREDGYARSVASFKKDMERFFYDNYAAAETIALIENKKLKSLVDNVVNSIG